MAIKNERVAIKWLLVLILLLAEITFSQIIPSDDSDTIDDPDAEPEVITTPVGLRRNVVVKEPDYGTMTLRYQKVVR